MKILINLFWFAVILLLIDLAGWGAWALSGQQPVDQWYVGTITNHVIRWVINLF